MAFKEATEPARIGVNRELTCRRGVLYRLVERMKPSTEHFDYDVATYVVADQYVRGQYLYPYRWSYDPWWGINQVRVRAGVPTVLLPERVPLLVTLCSELQATIPQLSPR
jgi:hypothetical protein